MKHLTILLSFLLVTGLQAQNSSSSQKTLITKRTATWCPNCGTWGWDFAKAIEELDNPNAVLIRAHYSGDLQSQVADEITANFDPVYQPEFYINEVRQDVGSTTWSGKLEEFKNIIDNNASASAKFSLDISGTYEGNTFSATASAETLVNVTGQYYLALYVVEDSITNRQTGLSNDAVHNGVLRWSLSGGSFGSEILNGPADGGSSFSTNVDFSIEDEDLEGRNFRLLVVVWEKVGDKYSVSNLHSMDLGRSSSVQNTYSQISDFHYANQGSETVFSFTMPKRYDDSQIFVHSLEGRLLRNVSFDSLIGSNSVAVNMNNVPAQIVLVTISGNGSVLMNEKVLLR